MIFNVGDKVICKSKYFDHIKHGEVVTVRKVCLETIELEESPEQYCYDPARFILAETTDIDRALDNLKRDVWVEVRGSDICKNGIYRVESASLVPTNLSVFRVINQNGVYCWVNNDFIRKVFFYDPIHKETIKIGDQEYLKSDIEEMLKDLKPIKKINKKG